MKHLIRKNFLLPLFLFAFYLPSKATHIVGGDITVKSLGSNNFEITLTFYRDCNIGNAAFDASITLGIYDLVTQAPQPFPTFNLLSATQLQLGDSCYTPPGMCVEQGIYQGIVNLPNNPNGYYISWHRCCRNAIINNINTPGGSGYVFYAEIPDPALQNSSPVFNSYPDAYMCANSANFDDFSATDSDGDSLVYSLSDPLDCSTNGICGTANPIPLPAPQPYTTIPWLPPYSLANIMGDPAMAVNYQTGIVTTNPPTNGVFVFCVKVEEFRGGIKIGEIRRDVQYSVQSCALPTVNITGPNPLCVGNSTTLTATGGNNYIWNGPLPINGQTTSSVIFSPTATGTYTFSVYTTVNSTCHIQSNTYTVSVNPGATAITATVPDTICLGASATLSASGGGTYVWSPSATLNNSTSSNPIATPVSTTTYSVVVTNSFGCTATSSIPVVVVGSPSINLGPDQSVCLGNPVTLSAGASPGASYSWSPGTGLSCTTCSNPSVTAPYSNTYTVVVSFSSGCSAAGTIVLTVGSIPFISAIASPTICVGDSAILNANVSNVPTAQQPVSWSWTPPNTLNNPSLQNPTTGAITTTTFVVTVTDAYGCTDDTSTIVYVQTVPSVTWAEWTPTLTCDGYVVPLKANVSSNGQSVYWDFGDGTYANTTPPNTDPSPHAYPFNGTYNVTVIVYNAPCSDTLDTTLIVSDVKGYMNILPANVFTPNADGKNDCFRPSIALQNIPSTTTAEEMENTLSQCIEMEVFDRWGIKMFESTDNVKCWDGKTKGGTPAKEGTYYYIAKFNEITIRGFVELLR